MNVEQIFTHLEETKLINILSKKKNLIFIGDELTVNYLKSNSILQDYSDKYNYFCWSNSTDKSKLLVFLKNLNQLTQYKIIIASATNEHLLKEQVRDYLSRKNIKIEILKLFSDILISIILKEKKFLQTSEIEFHLL